MINKLICFCFFFLSGFVHLARGEMSLRSNKEQNRTKQILEGGSIDVVCNSSGHEGYRIYWESSDEQFRLNGSELLLTNIKRERTGLYVCYAASDAKSEVIDYIFIDVLYPAKILSWKTPSYKLYQNDTLNMVVAIEGNPPPNNMMLSQITGRVVFRDEGEGTKNVTIISVQCNEHGIYFLQSVNRFSSVSLTQNIPVYCAPYVNPDMPTAFDRTPRLGEESVLEIDASGYPAPNFTWWHNGRQVQHIDDEYTSKVIIENIAVDDFGVYHQEMENTEGVSSYTFHVIPTGPPDPSRNLTVLKTTPYSVTLRWIPGYDYNNTQTFVVMKYQHGGYINLKAFKDESNYFGNAIIQTVDNLESSESYNITVISKNKHGQCNGQLQSVSFITQGSTLSTAITMTIVTSAFVAFVALSMFCVVIRVKCAKNKRHNGYSNIAGSNGAVPGAIQVSGRRTSATKP